MSFAFSLRTSLFNLAVLSLAPIVVASVAVSWSLMARLDALAASEAKLYAHSAAAHYDGVIEGAHHLLRAVAAAPAARLPQAPECDALLAETVARFPQYRAVGIGDAEGRPVCTSPGLAGRTLAAAAEVARARAGFNVVPLPGHAGQPVPVAVLTTADDSMRMDRVVMAVIEPGWLNDTAPHVGLPPGMRLRLIGPDGRVLSPEADMGRSVALPDTAVAEIDGQLTALWPIQSGGLRLMAEMPRAQVWWRFADVLGRAPLDMLLALVGGLAIAGLGIHRLVLVKVDRMGEAARRIRAGELGVRSGLGTEMGEFGRLARTFDTMAAAMDDRALSYQDSLRASETRWRALARVAPVAIFRTDTCGSCCYVNERWTTITGQSGTEAMGAGHLDCLHPEDRAWVAAALLTAMAAGRPIELSYRCRRPDGATVWVLTRAVAEFDGSGKPLGYVGTMTDITGERALQRQLTEAREAAEQANHAKSRFLASASHDLRQPFQAMRLFSAALAPYLVDEPAARIAAKLEEAMTAGELLLKALLDISTLEAGTVTPKPAPVAVAALIDRLAREFQPQAEAEGLSFRARAIGGMVVTDPVLLERMLRNLLHNAVRYTRRGGVLLAARRRGGAIVFEVWDTGIGIAAAEQDKVFEDFYQVGNLERDRARGLGLGLSVVARTARLLGHEVTLRSRPGRGSVFAITVRVAAERGRTAA